MTNAPILQFDLPGLKKVRSGKVREVYDLGDRFLLVASDRISAFDVIMPNGIPRKGEVLTQISHFWFEKFSTLVPNHLLAKADDPLPKNLQPFAAQLARRSMIVKRAKPLAIECIVRGYLSGSGWKEYKKSQTVCGIKLPAGLTESAELPEPIFTPSTKAEAGHDENISFDEACKITGTELATQARDLSLKIYKAGRDYARQRGIIIADTKFEFGLESGSDASSAAVVNGFTGSSIWHALYAFPPTSQDFLNKGFADFARRWLPILKVFEKENINFALEVHPTEIAFDIASAKRALEAVKNHPRFGFNYDPSHLAYQGVNYVKFIREFPTRIFHAHMKDVWWGHGDGSVGVFGGHTDFTDPRRFWDFRSLGHGDINFEEIIVALNDAGYRGPLSVEWEDGRMDRVHGATESCAFVRKLDFTPNAAAFDAAFARKK